MTLIKSILIYRSSSAISGNTLTDFDASGGTFPSGALRGAEYQVTVAGVLGGEYVPIGSILKARQNAPTNDWLITGWKLI